MADGATIRGTALGSQTPATALATFIALGAALCLAFAVAGDDEAIAPGVLAVCGAAAAVFAAITLWLLPRLPRVFVDVWVTVLALTVTFAAVLGANASSDLAAAMAFCLLATFCGYFLPLARLILQVGLMVVLFTLLAAVSQHLASAIYAALVAVTIVSLAWFAARMSAMLADVAVRDPLTGVLNRRGLVEAADLVHSLAVRADRRASVVAIDVNRFKEYNDRHGHAAGDRLLVDLTAGWRTTLRATDILARTGGDEFVLVLAETDAAAAHALLARLHETARTPWSAGVVEWQRGESLDAVLRRADESLYLAKATRSRPAAPSGPGR